MKKFLLLSLIAALLLSGVRVNVAPAYFAASNYGSSAVGPAMHYKTAEIITQDYFTVRQNGVVKLIGDTFKPQGWMGLISVSGTCTTARAPGLMTLTLVTDRRSYTLAASGNNTNSFNVTLPAPTWMQITAEQTSDENYIECFIAFQVVR